MPNAKPPLVLLIGEDGARLSIHRSRASENGETLFAAACDEPSEKTILDLVARHGGGSRLTILLDTLAQDYRVETVPRVNPLDRAKLIRRRLSQSFPSAAATAALKLDSSRVGLASWQADKSLRRWLDKLGPYAPRVALLPIEGASLAARIAPRDVWTLILSLQRTGGLRQIVTHKGYPVFTRLTPAPTALTGESIAAAAVQDLKTTLGYLHRLGLKESRNLHVIALLPETARAAFEQAGLGLRNLTLLPQDGPYGDSFLARDFARRKTPRLDVTPRNWKQASRDSALRSLGKKLSLVALALSLLAIGAQAVALGQALIRERQEAARRDDAHERLEKERAESAPITEPLGRLRAAVERERVFADTSPAPWPALDRLSQALPPDMRLAALDWQAPETAPGGRKETLLLTLRLPTAGNREQWRRRLEETAQTVGQAFPEFALSITRSPYPTTPQEPLTGGNAAATNAAPTADLLFMRKEFSP